MSTNDIDGRLQDYLDGRMPEQQREAFEARIRQDAELAERVRAASELRSLLREEPIELPPGFHRRARERFEASRRPWAPLRTLVSWEAAGLAAAVLLLAAIVLPFAFRSGLRVPETAADRTEPVKEELRKLEIGEPVEEPAETVPEEKGLPEAGRGKHRAVDDGEAEREFSPEPPPAAIPVPERRDEIAPKKRSARLSAPEPEESPEYDAAREAAPDSFGFAKEKSARPEAQRYRQPEGAATELTEAAIRGVALLPGALDPETVEIVTTKDEWNRIRHRPGMEPANRLRPDFSRERIILIGPGGAPVNCDGIFTRPEAGVLSVLLPEGRSGESAGGCAAVVPLSPEPIEIRTVAAEGAP